MENKKNENSLMDLWDNIKDINTCVIRVPEEEKRERGQSIFVRSITENFPNLKKETYSDTGSTWCS